MPRNEKGAVLRADEDMERDVAQGLVHMDPQTLAREDPQVESVKEDRKEEEELTIPTFKAILILPGSEVPIGQFLSKEELDTSSGVFITCKIEMTAPSDWTSGICFHIRAKQSRPLEGSEFQREEHTLHDWKFWFKSTNDLQAKPEVYEYPREFMNEGHHYDQEYVAKIIKKGQKQGKSYHDAGYLKYTKFTFEPAKTHTEGILTAENILGLPRRVQEVQDTLFRLFASPQGAAVEMAAFFVTQDFGAYIGGYAQVLNAFTLERQYPPWTRFFGGRPDAKCKLQKGQITPRDNRPHPKIPFALTYGTSEECWVTEGMSLIYQEENEIARIKAAQYRDCQLRVLQTVVGADLVYLALLRLSDDFDYRFSTDDAFVIKFSDKEEWAASIQSIPFPYASSLDHSIVLKRPIRKDDRGTLGFSTYQLDPNCVFLLKTPPHIRADDLEVFCHRGPFIKVNVVPIMSPVPYRFRLAAIKTLNSAHIDDKNHTHNGRWERLLLGQDLRATEYGNVFEGVDIEAKLKEWGLPYDQSQIAALRYQEKLPNGLGIIRGAWGTGKTNLDVYAALLIIACTGRTVKVLSPTNMAADDFILRLLDLKDSLEKKGIHITTRAIVRYHAPSTEARAVDVNRHQFTPPPILHRRWRNEIPIHATAFEKIAMEILDKHYENPHGVKDKRYQLAEASFATLLLSTAGLIDRPRHNPISSPPPTSSPPPQLL